jgi:hypothetical protein
VITTTDTAPRVCACPDCLGLAPDWSPVCRDCYLFVDIAAVYAWRAARRELRNATADGEARVAEVWMRALLACEAAVVAAARGRAPTLPVGYACAGAAA